MTDQQTIFEMWNFTFLFVSLSMLTVFTVDMIGHSTKTISTNVYTLAAIAGFSAGELCFSFGPIFDLNTRMVISIVLTLVVSTLIPLKFRTTDQEIPNRRVK
jgi:hypothetical protein